MGTATVGNALDGGSVADGRKEDPDASGALHIHSGQLCSSI